MGDETTINEDVNNALDQIQYFIAHNNWKAADKMLTRIKLIIEREAQQWG